MNNVAVCLLTCDRRDYTATTLASFAQHNDLSRFAALLHADDASDDMAVASMPGRYGFRCISRPSTRCGWLPMRRLLFAEAAKQAEWVLFLENDIEWARAFPWPLFEFIASKRQFYCLRLQGAFKDREQQQPFMVHHKANRTSPVRWMRLKHAPEKAQATRIHWSAQPAVTRVPELLDHHLFGMEAGALTARVVENVTYHIGVERTTAVAPAAPEAACHV